MSNIFKLTDDFKTIVDMADQLDEQTLEDMLEALGEATAEKVASTIAVIKSVKGELEVAKEYKKDIESRMKTMENTVKRLTEYIKLGVEVVGQPKKDAPDFKKLEIKDAPWVKSVWTQNNPPSVHIIDEQLIEPEFMIPQPDKVDAKGIAAAWKALVGEYEEKREAYIIELEKQITDGELSGEVAELMLAGWEEENQPHIDGVEIKQTIGVRFK